MGLDLSPEGLRRDTDVEFFRAGGPGGQHRNKTETAVRLHHRPTGVRIISVDERSRTRNLERAFERLHARLVVLTTPRKPRTATKVPRGEKKRRRESKARRAGVKQLRGRVRGE